MPTSARLPFRTVLPPAERSSSPLPPRWRPRAERVPSVALLPSERNFSATSCLPGTYGENCNQVCQYSGKNEECHHDTGRCGCLPGYYGTHCDLQQVDTFPKKTMVSNLQPFFIF
ncbi:uncharacterized protein PHA67_021682 [Liasis olivaceus]